MRSGVHDDSARTRRRPQRAARREQPGDQRHEAHGEAEQPEVGERLVHVAVRVPALGGLVAEAQLRLGEGARAGARELVLLPDVDRPAQ